jgi:transposase
MYCGIDVSKNKSNVCILDEKKNIVSEFSIIHDQAGFEELEKHLTPETKIGMETTGNYCKIIYRHLKEKYDVHYVDNVQMKMFARLNSPTIKNDVVDARLIAKFLSYDYKQVDPIRVNELKDMVQLHQKLITQLAKFKIMFKEQTNIIFPELETVSGLGEAMGILNLMFKYPSPKLIAQTPFEDIEEAILEKLKHRAKYNKEFIMKLQDLARNSVGVKEYPLTCYQYTIRILMFYQQMVNELRDKMLIKLMDTPYYKILDKECYDIVSLSKIVGEVGDIRRFANHRKFVSYCGLNVTEKQSGNTVSQNQHITKKGDRILRFTFYSLAFVNVHKKKGLDLFYERLVSKGKHSRKAMTACARKFAVWTFYEMKRCHEH